MDADKFTHKAELVLKIDRCWECGRWWAVEQFAPGGDCPCCAKIKYGKLWAEFEKLERTLRALRGALTAAKRRFTKGRR